MVGTISNLLSAKKFGFIAGENGQEYFFHLADVLSEWTDIVDQFESLGGAKIKVTFEPIKTPKGPRAKNVMLFEV